MRWPCYEGCTHYGTQFERREERREEREEFDFGRYPLYSRLRRHRLRRGFPY